MRKMHLLALTLLFTYVGVLQAASTVTLSVDTSTFSGTAGSLDFQFNPGPLITQPATVQILGFTGGSFSGPSQLNGSVSGGPLPAAVTMNNTNALNEYFEGFTFARSILFTLSFSGPAITAPDGVSTSGSLFAFSMFSDAAGTVPAPTTDSNGLAATVEVGLDGSLTTRAVSPAVLFTPEPASLGMAAGALGFLAFASLKKRLSGK